MAKKKTPEKVSDLIFDDKNFNTGTPFGEGLIKKSFEKFGAARSILLDKNNKIIAGNKSTQSFADGGGENVIVVETDGKTLVAVKRTDIDLDTPEGRELALADNASAKANIIFDAELIEAEVGEAVMVEWGLQNISEDGTRQPTGKLSDKFGVPPFSVLNAREGWWQDRKRQWLSLGIESEIGRGGGRSLIANGQLSDEAANQKKISGLTGGQKVTRTKRD